MAQGGAILRVGLNKTLGDKTGPLFKSPPRPLLNSGLWPLDKYGTCQETISRRSEQRILHLAQGWNDLGRGHSSSRSRINAGFRLWLLFKSFVEPLLKSGLGSLSRYGTYQTINGRLEQVYLPSDPRLEWAGRGGEGALFELDLKKCWGQNVGTDSSPPPPPPPPVLLFM